jgi:phosphoglycolate phosphatase
MKLLIFDLDGTLIDSKQDIVNGVNAARAHLGLSALDVPTVASYVGNGAPVLIRKALGPEASEETVAQALEFFVAFYHEHPLVHTVLYPGVREALDAWHAQGKTLAVLTNKPEKISHVIVDGLGLDKHFLRVYGGDSFPEKKPDPMAILSLMKETQTAAEQTAMVGDSYVDMRTARNAGCKAWGVSYGFQPESLIADPPDVLVDDMRELLRFS